MALYQCCRRESLTSWCATASSPNMSCSQSLAEYSAVPRHLPRLRQLTVLWRNRRNAGSMRLAFVCVSPGSSNTCGTSCGFTRAPPTPLPMHRLEQADLEHPRDARVNAASTLVRLIGALGRWCRQCHTYRWRRSRPSGQYHGAAGYHRRGSRSPTGGKIQLIGLNGLAHLLGFKEMRCVCSRLRHLACVPGEAWECMLEGITAPP